MIRIEAVANDPYGKPRKAPYRLMIRQWLATPNESRPIYAEYVKQTKTWVWLRKLLAHQRRPMMI